MGGGVDTGGLVLEERLFVASVVPLFLAECVPKATAVVDRGVRGEELDDAGARENAGLFDQ